MTITDLLRIVFYNDLSKRLPPKAAKIKPVLFIELEKEKRQPFNRRPNLLYSKKILSETVFLFTRATSQTNMLAYSLGDCRDNQRSSQSVFRLVYANSNSVKLY